MERVQFPQVDNVPSAVKAKVMAYVAADSKIKWSLIKRVKLARILIPTFVMWILFVWAFSIIYSVKVVTSNNNNELEKKLVEIENILNDLDKI